MSASDTIGTVGSEITFNCSSDLHPVRVEWYRDSVLLSQTSGNETTITIDVVSTDDEGAVYTCNAVGHRGSQERNITLNVQGKRSYEALVLTCVSTRFGTFF